MRSFPGADEWLSRKLDAPQGRTGRGGVNDGDNVGAARVGNAQVAGANREVVRTRNGPVVLLFFGTIG
jgi:hypothetical protein